MVLFPKAKKHKISAIGSLVFAVVFVVFCFSGTPFQIFYMQENAFVILLFSELYMEQSKG